MAQGLGDSPQAYTTKNEPGPACYLLKSTKTPGIQEDL